MCHSHHTVCTGGTFLANITLRRKSGLPFGNQIKPHHSVKGRKEAGPRRLDPAVTYILSIVGNMSRRFIQIQRKLVKNKNRARSIRFSGYSRAGETSPAA